jgi:nucleoside-diphosphate-sugar epimerase
LTHVENAAAAHLQAAAALLRPGAAVAGQAYFIGDAEPVRLWDWLRDLLGRLGLRLPPRAVPFRVAYAAGAVEELLHRLLPALGEPCMTRFVASQLALDHWFRHDAARRDFGYRPVAEPAAELERLVAWLRAGMPGPGGPC